MSKQSFSSTALVLKHWNTGETDRLITVLTQELGKCTAVAKGVRKTSSGRSSSLEPGNIIKCSLVTTRSLPILTQALLITDASTSRNSLTAVRKLYQLLEILDRLFVEEELDEIIYRQVLKLHQGVVIHQLPVSWVRTELTTLVNMLGFEPPTGTDQNSLLDHVAELTGKPLRSFEYLLVKSS